MVKIAIFRKERNNPLNRKLVHVGNGKSTKAVIKSTQRAGVLTSGDYVAFRVCKSSNNKCFKISGISVTKKGVPFKH